MKLIVVFLFLEICFLLNAEQKTFNCFVYKNSKLNVNKINDYLKLNNYPELNDLVTSTNFSTFNINDKILFSMDFGVCFGGDNAINDNYCSTLGGVYTFVKVGYSVFSTNSLKLYPFIGIGWGNIDLSVVAKKDLKFEKIISIPNESGTKISKSGFIGDLGFGSAFIFFKNLIFDIKLGYTFPFSEGKWNLNGINLPDGPGLNFEGPFVQFSIGGG